MNRRLPQFLPHLLGLTFLLLLTPWACAQGPSLDVSAVPTTGYEDGMALPDLRPWVATSGPNGSVTLTQSPAPGTLLEQKPPALVTVTFSAVDSVGGKSRATVQINVVGATPIRTVLSQQGAVVFGIRQPATVAGFGPPEPGAVVSLVQMKKKQERAIVDSEGFVILEERHTPAPLEKAILAHLGDPSGDAALGTLVPGIGGINEENNGVLITGFSSNVPNVTAQTGTAVLGLPKGIRIKRFLSIDGNGSTTFFRAIIHDRATGKEKIGLFATASPRSIQLLAATGDAFDGRPVALISSLTGSPGTLADGRWRVNNSTIGALITFSDHSQGVFTCVASKPPVWNQLLGTGPVTTVPALNGAVINRFGLPGFGAQGAAVSVTLADGNGGATTLNDSALIAGLGGSSPVVLGRKGDQAPAMLNGLPSSGAPISAFSDPIVSGNGAVACLVTLAGPHPAGRSNTGIEFAPDGVTPVLAAATGAAAPGGGTWSEFQSLVLPVGPFLGPIFTGKLTHDKTTINSENDRGLWAVDSADNLQLLLRTEQKPAGKTSALVLQSFRALAPGSHSLGAASGFDNHGDVTALVQFAGTLQALVEITVP